MKKVIAVDFFCGIGGLTFGLKKAGIRVVKGIDIDQTAEKTYIANNPETSFLNADIRNLKARDILKGVDRTKNLLLFAGCAPCQPFSNHNRDSKYDRRKSLMLNFARLIEEVLPEFVIAENVPGFMTSGNRYHSDFVEVLHKNNYDFSEDVLNAANYGVPQSRKRYVLVASRLGKISLPTPTHGIRGKKFVTVRQAIKKYPAIKAGENFIDVPNHSSPELTEINMERIKLVPKNGGSRTALPKRLGLKCHTDHYGHTDVYGRMSWDKPSPTLTCRCISFSNGRFGHPTQNRAISVREAASLQTFPDSYVFYGERTMEARHVGNAVPVLLATKLGQAILAVNR